MEIYIRTDMELDSVARILRATVNAAAENQSPYQKEQYRHSLNYGGEYYLFEIFGLTLTLLRNSGEVCFAERADWPYYVVVSSEVALPEQGRYMAEHLASLLRANAGIQAEVDDFGA